MKIFILILSDRDIRPRRDTATVAVFTSFEDAKAAMESDISEAPIDDTEIERYGEDYATSVDGRFLWKIEAKILNLSQETTDNSSRVCHDGDRP